MQRPLSALAAALLLTAPPLAAAPPVRAEVYVKDLTVGQEDAVGMR